MKIKVQVKPRSKREGVEVLADGSYRVRAHAPPTQGKANERVRELLAQHFKVSPSRVQLISGAKSRIKIYNIER